MNAKNLVKRVADCFAENGIKTVNHFGSQHYSEHQNVSGERFFLIDEVHRHNGTSENVTARIEVLEVKTVWSEMSCSLKTIDVIKIPKNASDRVISNRVLRAIESFNQ